jgi:hypothetical protein
MFTMVVDTLTTNTERHSTSRIDHRPGRMVYFLYHDALLRTALRPGQGPRGDR